MSAPIAVLVVVLAALIAGISAHVSDDWPNYTAEQNSTAALTAENSSDDQPEQKSVVEHTDKEPVKKISRKKGNVCVTNCPDAWRPVRLMPWPI